MDGAGGFLRPKRRSGARRARVEAASSKMLLCASARGGGAPGSRKIARRFGYS